MTLSTITGGFDPAYQSLCCGSALRHAKMWVDCSGTRLSDNNSGSGVGDSFSKGNLLIVMGSESGIGDSSMATWVGDL